MPILDYPRVLHPSNPVISVPSFHTGALGFIPDTDVTVRNARAVNRQFDGWRHYELMATPFASNHGRMFRLECDLLDNKGVVYRLLDALAEIGVNILKEDSCTIDGGTRSGILHHIDLILDWSSAGALADPVPSSPSDRQAFRHMASRVPIDDARYIRLCELITIHCGHSLALDRAYGLKRATPSIRIQPFSFRSAGQNSISKTLTAEGSYVVGIPLNEVEVARVQIATGHAPSDSVRYLLSSDSESRTLRILFLSRESTNRTEHVAFRHRDEPGVLRAIGAALESANYNIVTSLLRKEFLTESVWELVLEYKGKEDPANSSQNPDGSPESTHDMIVGEELLRRLAGRLHTCTLPPDVKRHISDAQVRIVHPSYPRPESKLQVPLFTELKIDYDSLSDEEPDPDVPMRYKVRMDSGHVISLNAIEKATRQDKDSRDGVRELRARELDDFLGTVRQTSQRSLPRLFLSYSGRAHELARLFWAHPGIQSHFEPLEYQEPDDDKVLRSAMDRIRSCDLFVGLWIADGPSHVTTWMPFEHGAAHALGRPIVMAYDKALPTEFVDKIDRGRAPMQFSIATFANEYLEGFVYRINRKWQTYCREQLSP